MKRISVVIFSLLYIPLWAADCPIIFVHGSKGGGLPSECWKDWHGALQDVPYTSAMERIINEEYKGYTAGTPLDCHVNTVLTPTGGETRKIYNFSYYNPDGTKGVIGSNGRYLPAVIVCNEDFRTTTITIRQRYIDAMSGGSWANNFAIFVEKVLEACYGPDWQSNPNAKVDVVAHCMGGLVVRAAMKWYNLPSGEPVINRIRKLLTISTPHYGTHYGSEEAIAQFFMGHESWQRYGEDLELNAWPSDAGPVVYWENVYFEDVNTGEKKIWCDWLGYDTWGIPTVTMRGNRGGAKSILN